MPAAAVTPAPIAYIKVAAVKKLVVGSGLCRDCQLGCVPCNSGAWRAGIFARSFAAVSTCPRMRGWCWMSVFTPSQGVSAVQRHVLLMPLTGCPELSARLL